MYSYDNWATENTTSTNEKTWQSSYFQTKLLYKVIIYEKNRDNINLIKIEHNNNDIESKFSLWKKDNIYKKNVCTVNRKWTNR